MIMSMTGFASLTIPLLGEGEQQCSAEIEIKTFNGRFFEPSCKMPGHLSMCEIDIVSLLKKALYRGRVYCTVRINGYAALEKLILSEGRVQEYLDIATQLKENFGVPGELNVHNIITLPSLFSTERRPLPSEATQAFMAGVARAIERVVETRIAEGERLKKDLTERFTRADHLMKKIHVRAQELVEAQKAVIAQTQKRVQEGDEEAKLLLPDQYSALDKIDLHEEIVRFHSHIESIHAHLASSVKEKGRRFDFILQELMRETNTVTAKCSDYQISADAVEIKVELEKAREQTQNIV